MQNRVHHSAPEPSQVAKKGKKKKKKKEKKEMGAGDRRERGRLWLANREGGIGDEKIERERDGGSQWPLVLSSSRRGFISRCLYSLRERARTHT